MAPTVFPQPGFNASADAKTLNKAFKGFGTNEAKVIEVLANRTNKERVQIATAYKELFGEDLDDRLKSELGGAFETVCMAMLHPLVDYYAKELHDAMSGVGTKDQVLVDILCTASNYWIKKVTAKYNELYGKKLENDIKSETTGTFENLLVSICQAKRDETLAVNESQVKEDAQALFDAGEGQMGTDESMFNMIMVTRSYAHLRKMFNVYETLTGKKFCDVIKNEFAGNSEMAMLAIVASVNNTPRYFARRLHESMSGAGTNDKDLIRLVVSRSEVDMGYIKQEYLAKYQKTLSDAIKSDCAGDYQRMLIALIE